MTMNETDLEWLESLELPSMSWLQIRQYHDQIWHEPGERNPLSKFVLEFMSRYDAMGRLDWACADPKLPIEQRERIAKAYFRVAAWELVVSNELNEYQKTWAVTQVKKKAEHAERILAAWMASPDPHAPLVRALRDTWPKATAIEIARVVERICNGWGLPPERVSKASQKTLRKRFAELAAMPAVVDAVLRWLPVIPDFERRVLHAGAVLASEGSERSALALRPVVAEAEQRAPGSDRAWLAQIWSPLAPKGSAVSAMLQS